MTIKTIIGVLKQKINHKCMRLVISKVSQNLRREINDKSHIFEKLNKQNNCMLSIPGLRHTCTDSNQCDEGMICTNETKPSTVFRSSPSKLCLCDEEVGYEESINLNYCSGK